MKKEEMQNQKCGDDHCTECKRRDQEHKENEEASFAVLVSLVPLLVLTFFSQIGLL